MSSCNLVVCKEVLNNYQTVICLQSTDNKHFVGRSVNLNGILPVCKDSEVEKLALKCFLTAFEVSKFTTNNQIHQGLIKKEPAYYVYFSTDRSKIVYAVFENGNFRITPLLSRTDKQVTLTFSEKGVEAAEVKTPLGLEDTDKKNCAIS